MNRLIALLPCLLLAACSSHLPTEQQLMHHHWVLESVNEQAVQADPGSAPDLEIGENFTINGIAGCNRYFGKANLDDDRFWVTSLGHTNMTCDTPLDRVEQQVLAMLQEGATLRQESQWLVLEGRYTLRYRLEDWK
ncbi:heat shock protein HslJ [Aeromonas sp. RU39B]|jgi:heat shock protein HslJ|uniref:META domain-containing protein n=1 Tax=Aeromonas sp. RU39B TaxID=1907416 RepID=UPI000953A239|nr:META domain-containing protein [Aeromonas sp. RU39B]SIR14742.1 heat shock protein HslJ [Aeromonas sp. RU39B]